MKVFNEVFYKILIGIEGQMKSVVGYDNGYFTVMGQCPSKYEQRSIVESVLADYKLDDDELYEVQLEIYKALCLNEMTTWPIEDTVCIIANHEVNKTSMPKNVIVFTIQDGVKLRHYYALGRRTAGCNVYIDLS